ncbi:conserved protein containing a Zn-ribbon-like motif, possibly RNA-binding [Mycobacteroides abscessus subsp. abscessus]|uniref:Conserved protein containing a Zn-ribbon-like motif, possibly RNA-binding n=4 Tax=Mycobacteroides abscessus TaxID=36809 RepID=A0A1N2N240_9MYCO|nr:CGNR zinc finger domain-containing protein [Mycobacteroides abscessus]ETZ90867.1 hypothetical protein L829_4453 [Mycobacteroides abscessus MAB_030201_1075]AKP59632.1 Zn-ribbon-like motif protein [Mycobacteroides abscessus UC22]ALM17908.1 RNA-binding protein [Mycobacteroides abscessus]AMU22474.1 RNA-binding protein [Mycobacteroides abscessus]AMU47071.1 RNA-binding protein [Mycobacteroides abscessus]
MLFTHDTEQGLRSAAELINTGRNDRELLPDVAALPPLLDRYGWTGRRDGDDAELEAVKALRARLGDIWARINDEEYVVRQVNALLADTHASPWLTRHVEEPDWHLHMAASDAPLADRLGAETAMVFADLVRTGEQRRLKTCAAPDCDAVLVDLSRNRSRMFCDTGNCGNRQHVAAYRERLRDEA